MRPILVTLAAAAISLPVSSLRGQQDTSYVIVVNRANPVTSMSVYKLSRLFQKKITRWDDGSIAEPVELPEDSPVRRAFNRGVHHKSMRELRAHWHRQIWTGNAVPPPELVSDEEVMAFVATNPHAVGYVGAGVELPDNVKILQVTR